MAATIYLNVVTDADPTKDAILHFDKLPGFKGDLDENLACGACKEVVGRNVSTKTIHSRFATTNRLIVQCTCGAYNIVPSQRPS